MEQVVTIDIHKALVALSDAPDLVGIDEVQQGKRVAYIVHLAEKTNTFAAPYYSNNLLKKAKSICVKIEEQVEIAIITQQRTSTGNMQNLEHKS